MGKKQIRKDFEELYIGQNTDRLVRKYYKNKRKEMLLLTLGGILIVLLVFVNEHQKSRISEDNTILRNKNGEGKKEISLEVKTSEGKWQEILLELEEQEYEEEELEELFEKAVTALEDLIKGENEDLGHVTKNLDLLQEMEGFPFMLHWESSNPKVIDSLGDISGEQIPSEGIRVVLTVTFQYEEWEKQETIQIRIYPDTSSDFLSGLKENLQKQESRDRKNERFQLPGQYHENALQWRYTRENSAGILGIGFLILLPFLSCQKDREIKKRIRYRRDKLQKEYPEFISRLLLYLEAGMNVNSAVFRIAEDYQKKKDKGKEESFLYEEILYVCRQQKNGLSQQQCYELLGKRCSLPCYRKLTGLLTQHLQKGSMGILESLRAEAFRANEDRKKLIRKQGEEMGTKLLFPMVMMLGIVMVLIMVPACFSFQM